MATQRLSSIVPAPAAAHVPSSSEAGLRAALPVGRAVGPLLGVLALALLCSGCGTTSVRMQVVRPSVFNARSYGGTASVAGFVAQAPNLVPIADAFRVDVERQIVAGHGGVVQLVQGGAGLAITGRVDEYGVRIEREEQNATCKRRVKVQQGGKSEEQRVDQPCKRYRVRWAARMMALVRITSGQGQTLFLRQLVEQDTGITPWEEDHAPEVRDLDRSLGQVRVRLAQRVAWLVVPHRERVTATLYDCPEPAAKTCDQGARALANSDYQGSLALYQQAMAMLQGKPGVPASEIAEIHWNRAIVAKYGRMFDLAIAELHAALRLENSGTYRRELEEVQRAAVEHAQLIDQGLGGQ